MAALESPSIARCPILSAVMSRIADVAVFEAGPWLVHQRNSTHALQLEHVDSVKYRTTADKTLDLMICNAILDLEGDSIAIFSEERGLITVQNRHSVDWDNPRRESVDLQRFPRVVVVDSLDGSLNWSSRGLSNNYSIAASFLQYGEVVEVVIFFPHDRELYIAKKGQGAWMKGAQDSEFTRLHTSINAEVNRAVAIVDHGKVDKGKIYPVKALLAQDGIGAIAIPDLVCSTASWRAMARGGAHAFLCYTVAPEDFYPSLLVTEAGGIVTTLDGVGQWNWNGDRSVFAAANPLLHERMRVFCNL